MADRRRRGFTLLEVLLALALASILVMAIGAAVRAHLRAMDVGRTDVEEAQLARALLGYIAADLQNIIHFEPQDVSSAEAMMQMAASAGGLSLLAAGLADGADADLSAISGLASGGGDASGSSSGGAGDSSSSSGSTSGDTAMASSMEPRRAAGVYGTLNQIEFDVRRAPRTDEYEAETVAVDVDTPPTHATDLRTITYFVHDPMTAGSQFREGVTADTGLARGETDRASAAWAYSLGELVPSQANAVILAPEVGILEFRYFDGTEWAETWDSEDRAAVPLAIEISLGVRRSDETLGVELATGPQRIEEIEDETQWLIYRLVVQIPSGAPSSPGDGVDDTSATSGESSSSTGSPSSGSGATGGTSSAGGDR